MLRFALSRVCIYEFLAFGLEKGLFSRDENGSEVELGNPLMDFGDESDGLMFRFAFF